MKNTTVQGPYTIDISHTPAAYRKSEWAKALKQRYFALEVETGAAFSHAHMTTHDIGRMRIIALTSDPMRTRRSTRDTQEDGDDSFVIEIPRSSSLRLSQGRCDQTVHPGSFAMITAAEGYVYEQPEANTLFSLKLPSRMVCARFPMAYEYLNRTFSPDCPTAGLFTDFAASACARLPAADADVAETTMAHLVEFLALALTSGREHVSTSAVKANHRRQAVSLVERNFRNPELRIADIAQSMRVSERYLQKIFADTDQSLGGILRDRRIAEARRLLGNLEAMRLTMTQVALKSGFSDSSYFCRVFRKEMAMSPTEFIRAAST